MKARPRRVEREIAALLSEKFTAIGMRPVVRIAVLGRTGPDITLNEFNLVVDVKSRLQVPAGYIVSEPTQFGDLIAVPMSEINQLFNPSCQGKVSVTVEHWFAHMNEWTQENAPGGITALVLHKPKLPYGKSILIIHKNSKENFLCRMKLV